MMLPKGWVEATLGECSEAIQYGLTATSSVSGRGYRYIRITDIQDRGIDWTKVPYADETSATASGYEVVPEDILFARTGATVGKSILVIDVPEPSVFASYLIRVRCWKEILDPKFAAWYFQSSDYWTKIVEGAEGTGQPNFNGTKLRQLKLPLPPLNEQRRIVVKLAALVGPFARARAELDRVPVLAKALRLNALRRTFHWNGGWDGLPAGWALKRIDAIGPVQLGRQRSPKDHNGPYMRPYVRAANITWNGWDLSDVKEMNFAPAEFETFRLHPGDVLLNEGSGSAKEVGKPAVWNAEIEGACFQNTLLRVQPHNYLPELLRYCLLYIALSGQFIRNTKGVNIIHIGKAGLASTVIPVPPVEAQDQLVEELDAAFARADRLETEAARARTLVDRLESAIVAKAFRGKLVPQDPNDEPASVLLERMRAERSQQFQLQETNRKQEPTKQTRKRKQAMGKKRTEVERDHLRRTLTALGGSARARDLWQRSDMDIDEFYKQLRHEMKAGHISEGASKDQLVLADAT